MVTPFFYPRIWLNFFDMKSPHRRMGRVGKRVREVGDVTIPIK
jgi:hypothetical protein